jgi:hypothetical protein
MARAIEAFDAAGGSAFQRSNVRAASALFRVAGGALEGALREAEEALEVAREIGNPSQLAISFGAAPLVEIDQPALAASFAAAAGFSGPLGGTSLEAEQRALAQAREELGPDVADEISARVEAMSWDEMVDYVRAELDGAIRSTSGN